MTRIPGTTFSDTDPPTESPTLKPPVEVKMLILTDGMLSPPGEEHVREKKILQEARKQAAEGWVISAISHNDKGACVYFHRLSKETP